MGISSAPFVVGNLLITGSHIVDETGSKGPAGDVRAWDVGRRLKSYCAQASDYKRHHLNAVEN